MEEMIPSLKSMLKEAIDIKTDASKLTITMTVKKKIDGEVAEPEEIITMLKMYGGLREEIPIQIDIDNNTQDITLRFQEEEDFKKVEKIFDSLWDNAIEMLRQAMTGDFSRIKDVPKIDD